MSATGMREAIQQYVDREEKQLAFRQEALTAWQEYQETGLHVTANEVVNWLETWGTETEAAAPVCLISDDWQKTWTPHPRMGNRLW